MQENLLSSTNIMLFGRVFPLAVAPGLPAGSGANNFLLNQLADPAATFARIYAISYEGSLYNLPKPAIYLVHGAGTAVGGAGKVRQSAANPLPAAPAVVPPAAVGVPAAPAAAPPLPTAPSINDSGVVGEDFDFESDVLYWEYDKGDFTLRIDIASGTFDDILLEATLSVTARDALVSRSDLTSRSDLASRSDLTSRSDVTSRSDLTARHRLKG